MRDRHDGCMTTYVSANELRASVPATAFRSAGDRAVTVVNSTGLQSLPVTLSVTNPAPSVTTYSPTSVSAGSGSFILAVQGNGFSQASDIYVDNTPIATQYISTTRIQATAERCHAFNS